MKFNQNRQKGTYGPKNIVVKHSSEALRIGISLKIPYIKSGRFGARRLTKGGVMLSNDEDDDAMKLTSPGLKGYFFDKFSFMQP